MKLHVNRNTVIDSQGGIIKFVGSPGDNDEIYAEDNLQIRHTGYLVDYFENEKPNFLQQMGFPPDTNPEEIANLLVRLQGKDKRECKEIIESTNLVRKWLSLGTLGDLASITSLIYTASIDPNIHNLLASLNK